MIIFVLNLISFVKFAFGREGFGQIRKFVAILLFVKCLSKNFVKNFLILNPDIVLKLFDYCVFFLIWLIYILL